MLCRPNFKRKKELLRRIIWIIYLCSKYRRQTFEKLFSGYYMYVSSILFLLIDFCKICSLLIYMFLLLLLHWEEIAYWKQPNLIFYRVKSDPSSFWGSWILNFMLYRVRKKYGIAKISRKWDIWERNFLYKSCTILTNASNSDTRLTLSAIMKEISRSIKKFQIKNSNFIWYFCSLSRKLFKTL